MSRFVRLLTLLTVGMAGCSSPVPTDMPADAAGPDAFFGPSTAIFELPRDGMPTSDFYALPFPNDLRRRADGTLDLSLHPRPNQLLTEYLDVMEAKFSGFGTNQAIFFRFSAPIDVGSLPATPDAFRADDAAVYLIDVDPDSPDRGRRWPMTARFEHYSGEGIGTDWLSCLPYAGFPLRPLTTYAAVVTSRTRATDGTPIGAGADFQDVLSTTEQADLVVLAARDAYAPLLVWLDEPGGDERADVVSAAIFTTQDPTSEMGRIREVIYRDVPAPRARLKYVGRYPTFDLYQGTYDGPNFQTGTPPYDSDGGEIVSDAAGYPIVQRMESIRMAVAVPNGAVMPAEGWPVVIYAHGTGGDYKSFVRDLTADRMAQQGLAVISSDQVLHGPRNPAGGSEEIAFFNFQNPVAGRDNLRQGALDTFTVVRLAGDLVIDARHPGAKVHQFDAANIFFMGHSQGGITGPPALAYEPNVKGAVLSGAGGLLYLSFLNKTEPVNIPTVVGAIVRDIPLDEWNPFLALVQMFIERSDAVNYARLLAAEPVPGVPAKDIYQSEGLIDHYTPPVNIEALGVALGASPVEPILVPVAGFGLRGIDTLTAPVSGNLNGRTVVFLQYAAEYDDGHFVVFDIEAAQRQHAEFLGSLARTGTATLVP